MLPQDAAPGRAPRVFPESMEGARRGATPRYPGPGPESRAGSEILREQEFMQLFGNKTSGARRATTGIIPHPGFRVEPAEAGRSGRIVAARCPWIGAAETRYGIGRNVG